MRFFDHGRMLYCLDIIEPNEMSKLLAPGNTVPKRIFEGRYTLSKQEVVVEVCVVDLQCAYLQHTCKTP